MHFCLPLNRIDMQCVESNLKYSPFKKMRIVIVNALEVLSSHFKICLPLYFHFGFESNMNVA